ncbi:hypothetical protein BJV78DRAFT_1155903 [Lactifluus subvellereus]|nr:hypothetical protein BJV78DRAFT_1155903 [Lactifluus subvellereus]
MVLLRFARWVIALYVSRRNRARNKKGRISPPVTIGALPDNVLLDIFDFYRAEIHPPGLWPWPWNRLVHVCQRWRYLVFASPLRLDLCLHCTSTTPVRETLDVWPPLPIQIFSIQPYDVDNIIATLEHRDRVRKIEIRFLTCLQLERLATMMQEPFPALTSLQLLQLRADETAPVLPDMFLSGSAPRLQTLDLFGIPFPGLPRLLLSASDLSDLSLWEIPHTSYISPEAMVTCLSALTRLTRFSIGFDSPASRPDQQRPPPLTRVILPALEDLRFRGVSEYLEDLVARIVAPRLDTLYIFFVNRVIFDIQQLPDFIGHVGILRSSYHAKVIFDYYYDRAGIDLYLPKGTDSPEEPRLKIYREKVDWHVWSVAQICNRFSFLLSIVEQLDIKLERFFLNREKIDMEDTQWLELFRPFTAVRTLRISRELQSFIVPALQELTGERATEVLPALDSLYLEEYQPSGSKQQPIDRFIAARQYSDHPVAVHLWERSEWEGFYAVERVELNEQLSVEIANCEMLRSGPSSVPLPVIPSSHALRDTTAPLATCIPAAASGNNKLFVLRRMPRSPGRLRMAASSVTNAMATIVAKRLKTKTAPSPQHSEDAHTCPAPDNCHTRHRWHLRLQNDAEQGQARVRLGTRRTVVIVVIDEAEGDGERPALCG